MKTKSSRRSALASEWISRNISAIADEVVATLLTKRSSLYLKYGERGRKKCHEDSIYHLHYLSEAIAGQSERLFVDYVGWAKVMLAARNIQPDDLILNLKSLIKVIHRQAPSQVDAMIVKYVESALEQFSSLPQYLPSYIVSSNPLADVANEYLNALLLLNRKGAEVTIRKHLERGLRLRDLVDQVVLPVQLEVGRLWQEKRITVVQEHYCTAATEMLLTELRERFRGIPRDVTALALCPEGEHHCLGIRLLSELLEADGWRVAYIGPNCPSADVLNHLRDTKTDLVAISVTTALSMAALRQLIMKVREVKASTAPRILVGGRALGTDPRLPRSLRADGYAANIFDGLALANRLVAMRKTSSA